MASIFLPPRSGRSKWSVENNAALTADVIGHKAAGLAQLPGPWRLDYAVLSRPLLEDIKPNARAKSPSALLLELSKAVLDALPMSDQVIVRSSVTNEWIDARGRYESRVVGRNKTALARAIAELYASARKTLDESPESIHHGAALIVQRYADARARGHLVNEYRHAQRKVDFLYEVEEGDATLGIAAQVPESFRLRRPIPVVKPQALTLDRFSGKLDATLQHAAAWLARNLGRGHAEWVLAGDRLWLVQFDREQKPASVAPLASWTEDASAQFKGNLEAFRAIDLSARYDRWRKTSSHRVISQAGLRVPPIYVLDDASIVAELLDGRAPEPFLRDLRALVALPTVLRLDVDAEHTDWSNLPAKGPVRSADEAAAFVLSAVSQARARNIPPTDIALVLHHFLPAKAAAWATADPNDGHVKIDSIWGLPDGLQAFPYDTTFVDLDRRSVAPNTRYKDEFLDVSSTGAWVTRRTPPRLARRPPLDGAAALRVAQGTAAIARARSHATRVMWFLQTDTRAGFGAEVPWILVDEENAPESWLNHVEAGGSEHSELAARLQRRIQLGNIRRLQSQADLDAFRQNPALYDVGGHCVLFRPSAELLRRRDFLRDVAETVSAMTGWYLVLEGSLLAHAPYQLRSLGLRRVISVWEYTKPPKRTHIGKLVRDKIPAAIESRGERTVATELTRRDLLPALRSKLVEEALEVFNAQDEGATTEELADVLTVIRALAETAGIQWSDVERVEREKSEKRGRFERGLFLSATAPANLALTPSNQIELRQAIRRLRYKTGIAVSLVPPFRDTMRKERLRFVFGEQQVYVTVTYRDAEVTIHLDEAVESENSAQLDLFDEVINPATRGD